jgi:hypothetical protein
VQTQQLPERRTFATLAAAGPGQRPPAASHPTWRLRRPGNGFVQLKAKGTAGLSVVFSTERGGARPQLPVRPPCFCACVLKFRL